MSLNWRDRLRNRTAEELNITQEELNYVWENIGDFCDASDALFKKTMKKDLSHAEIDSCSDSFTNEEFNQFSSEVIKSVLRKHGFRKKKKGGDDQMESDSDYDTLRENQGREMFEERSQPMEQRIAC
jgi:hypothetical protein